MPNLRKCKRHDCSKMLDYWSRKFYCSNACKQRDYRARTTPHYHVETNPYTKWCRCCGKQFVAFNSLAEYCSRACRQRFYREQKQLKQAYEKPVQMTILESAYTISNILP